MSEEANIYGIKSRRLRLQILNFLSYFLFQFYFHRKSRVIVEDNPSEKMLIVKEELDGIDKET